MSSGNLVGGIVGAAVGFVVSGFNPVGAAYGFALGAAAGGLLDPPKGPTVEGPRLSDLNIQTSTYGTFLARYYGTLAAHGNIIWLEGNKLKETVKKKKQGGKGGGGGTTTKTYTYSATFAIALGEGQLAGIKRIWCRDKLLYNSASDDLETIIASNQNASGWRFYPGSDDQLPDPRIEAEKGVGNTPAYRGTAYIVFDDFQLEDYGNTLEGAQFKFEVVTAAQYSVDNILNRAEPLAIAQSGALFNSQPERILRLIPFIGAPPYTLALRDHYTSNVIQSDFVDIGPILTNAQRIMGEVSYALLQVGNTQVVTDKFTYTGVPFTGSTSNFQILIENDVLYILCTGGSAFGQFARVSHGGVSAPINKTDRTYLSICFANGEVVAVTATEIIRFDPVTLDEIAAVSFTSSRALGQSNTYVNYSDGGLWVMPAGDQALQKFDHLTGEKLLEITGLPAIGGGSLGAPAIVIDGVYRALDKTNGRVYASSINTLINGNVPLADIIENEMELSSLITPLDINTSLLSDTVRGYKVSGGSIRSALEPLQGVWPFDVIQSGYQLKCVPRGQASVVTIPWEHLGANDGDESGDLLKQSREMDTQLPASTHIKYWDVNREYAQGEQYADRPGTSAVNRVDLEVPIVMNADEAAKAVDVLQALRWLERIDFEASLPPIYLALEPSDVITIVDKNATYQLRIKEKNDTPSGIGQCKLVPNAPSIYTSNAKGAEGVSPPTNVSLPGISLVVLMDIPLVDEVSQNAVGYASAMTGFSPGWPGAVLVRSADGGQTWEDLQGYTGKGGIAFAADSLPVSAGLLVDNRDLNLSFISGEPFSITREQLLTGYNYAAYGVNGRWEIVRFQTATLNGDGSYTLSGFVRGDKGTEWATGLHQVGDYFILLDDPDNAFIGAAVQTIGLARDYRAVTSGASVDSASDVPFTYNGVNLEPLSPVDAKATRDGSGNLSATFTRRSRLGSTWWGNGVEAPIGETTQAYEIDVMDGATVVRTINASTPAFNYSAAEQTTDFGSAQASITFRIYQLSEVVGRGFVREVTL